MNWGMNITKKKWFWNNLICLLQRYLYKFRYPLDLLTVPHKAHNCHHSNRCHMYTDNRLFGQSMSPKLQTNKQNTSRALYDVTVVVRHKLMLHCAWKNGSIRNWVSNLYNLYIMVHLLNSIWTGGHYCNFALVFVVRWISFRADQIDINNVILLMIKSQL